MADIIMEENLEDGSLMLFLTSLHTKFYVGISKNKRRNGHLVGWSFQSTFCIYESIYKLLFISSIQSIMIM